MNGLSTKPPKKELDKAHLFICILLIIIGILLIIIGSSCNAQDTIPSTLVIEDTTDTPTDYYGVVDAYNNTVSYNSNEYVEHIPGWIVNGEYLTLRFETLEPKYKVVTFYEREWYTLTETFVLEIKNIARKESVIIYNAGQKQIYFY